MKKGHNRLAEFLKNTRVLQSITGQTLDSMKYFKHAHNIKYFEYYDRAFPLRIDENFISFIERQTTLQFLSVYLMKINYIADESFLTYLNQIVEAILVRKTVKHLTLNVDIQVIQKYEFTASFYNALSKLENLALITDRECITGFEGD